MIRRNYVMDRNCVLTSGTIGDKLREVLQDDLKYQNGCGECITLPASEAEFHLNKF